MPGYVIHLAVAKEYLKKSKNRNENEEEFINGVIFPDSVKDKAITHYGEKSSKSNLYEFLKDKNVNNSFNRGYFLHLLTDYLFYNKYVDRMTKDMYNDYDITNKKLIDKYNVELPNEMYLDRNSSSLFKNSTVGNSIASNNIPMAVLGYLTPKEKRSELEVFGMINYAI